MRTIAITLKIPDNIAYTAFVALRRLGIAVGRVERSEIYSIDDGDEETLAHRIRGDETMFNPNKHEFTLRDTAVPKPGEVFIAPIAAAGTGPQAIAWRLFDALGAPVSDLVLNAAAERLLYNPAIERAITSAPGDRTGHFFP